MPDAPTFALPQTVRDSNLFDLDRDAQVALGRLNAAVTGTWGGTLRAFGAWVAGPVDRQADYTDRHAPPRLIPYDGEGRLINRILCNPAWEAASREVYARGIVGLNYGPGRAPYLATFAMGYLLSQADVSLHCPVTM